MNCKSHLLDSRALAMRWARSNEGTTEIVTTHGIYYSNHTPVELLQTVCLQFLSTLEGQINGSKHFFQHVLLHPYRCSPNLHVIQTSTCHNFECVWLFNENFTAMESHIKSHTLIDFGGDIQLIVPAPKRFIEQQRTLLHEFMNHHQKPFAYMFPGSSYFDQIYH